MLDIYIAIFSFILKQFYFVVGLNYLLFYAIYYAPTLNK